MTDDDLRQAIRVAVAKAMKRDLATRLIGVNDVIHDAPTDPAVLEAEGRVVDALWDYLDALRGRR